MSDPQTTSPTPTEPPTEPAPEDPTTPADPTRVVDDQVRTIVIPTTDSLSQERLQEIADSCVLVYEPAEGGGITVQVQDDDDARFWTTRGAIWGHLYDEVAAS